MTFRHFFLFLSLFIFYPATATAEVLSIGPSLDELLAKRAIADKKLADSSAVILSRRGEVVVDQKGFETSHYYNAIYIAEQSAIKDYSKLVSAFNSYYQEKQIDFARVITPDGKVINMHKDAISLVSSNNDDYFDEGKQYEFALPQLRAGSIIEYQATTKQIKPYIENEWYSSISFHFVKFLPAINWLRIDPVLETVNRVTLPKDRDVSMVNHNITIEPQVSHDNGQTTYLWESENQPGLELEVEMPSLDDILPTVYLSTMKRWSTVNTWFNGLYLPTQQTDADVITLANQLFQGKQTDQEKIRAVFEYIQKNIRYIGAHVNRGGYQPHSAGEVLKQAYGDCKDQTVLIIALLKQAGISAYPAMINTYPGAKFNDNLPMLNFDHMITYVETEQENYWLDTSGQTGTFPGISVNLEAKKAFVVTNEQGRIVQLPEKTSAENIANIDINFEFDNTHLNADIALDLTGHVETNLRNFIQFSPNKLSAAEQILSPFVFSHRINEFSNSDPIDITKPFTIQADFTSLAELTNEIDNFRYGYDFSAILSVFTALNNLPPVSARKQDFNIMQPITVVVKSAYKQPWQGSELIFSKPAENIQNEFFSLMHEVAIEDKKVVVTSTFVLPKQLIKLSKYEEFYQQVDGFSAQSQSLFIYQKPSDMLVKAVKGEGSIDNKLAQAKQLLEQSKFDAALDKAKEVIALDENHAEAQYILGLAYGFNGDDTLSEKAFSRAEQLGYQF